MHEGHKLRILVKADSRRLNGIAKLLNVAPASIIRWYELESLRPINKELLAQIGINIDSDANENYHIRQKQRLPSFLPFLNRRQPLS